jgi:hypothetical protein
MHMISGGRVAWQSTSDGGNSYSYWAAQQLRRRGDRIAREGKRVGALLQSMIPKSVKRFSEKIMLKQEAKAG